MLVSLLLEECSVGIDGRGLEKRRRCLYTKKEKGKTKTKRNMKRKRRWKTKMNQKMTKMTKKRIERKEEEGTLVKVRL
jgi:hypothetical protein